MQHLFGFDGEHCEVFSQLGFAQRVLDIFDNVELDVAVAQNLQRAIGFPSVGVVVDGYFFHDVSVLSVKKQISLIYTANFINAYPSALTITTDRMPQKEWAHKMEKAQ
jgi:hypothetical protein